MQKAQETLDVYGPLAHRLGIHKLKWELEDLAFETLHPRKYAEIKAMVAERRADREEHVNEASAELLSELDKVDIPAEISGRAKHSYSIYDKMAKKGREFNEIYDLTAMRVICERGGDEGTRDCYGALGLIHSLWKPMPGRFKDYVAMAKFNGYRALHTTVIGPQGRPLEIQIRTREMHREADLGIAAHWLYKRGDGKRPADQEWLAWVERLLEWGEEEADPREFLKSFRTDLFDDEVYVFTPKGEVKTLPAGSTPIDFAYAVHTDVGHRTVGSKVNGRIVPLHYTLRSGDFVEILTSKGGRGPSRDWMNLARSSRARNKIRAWFSRETREDTEQKGREALEQALKAQKLPYRKLAGSAVLAQVIREAGFKKAEDFYIALGSGKLPVSQIVKKVLTRLKTAEVAEEETVPLKPKTKPASSDQLGITVHGVDAVLVRLAKCCTPVPSDEIVGYISLGKGITIHRKDCPNVKTLMSSPERFTQVDWDGEMKHELPGRDRRRRLGPAALARGRRPHVCRARREHRLVRRHRRGSAGQELVHGRARGREGAARSALGAAERRGGLRRLSRHAVLGRFGAPPKFLEGAGKAFGLDPVGRVEVVALLEHLELEVREHSAQTFRELPVLVRVAESAEREVDRAIETAEGLAVDVAPLERATERADPCRTLGHPGRRFAGRRRWRLDARLELQPREGLHQLLVREPFEPVVLEPERLLRGTQIPVSRPGGLEQGKAREPLRSCRCERDRGRCTARVPDEMEPLPTVRVGLAQHARNLDLEAVVRRRLERCVDLEILRDRVNVRAERGDERAVRKLCREHDPGKQDHTNWGQPSDLWHIPWRRSSKARPHHR